MAKVVRLKGPEQREWNANMSILVDAEGVIVRNITPRESLTMFQVGRHVAKTRQAHTEKTPEETSTVEARLETLQGGGIIVRFYIDGMVVVGGREAMKARILQEHGPCILYRTNGKLLCVIHDPNARAVTAAEANRTTPAPDVCICKDWEGRVKGKHHPICQHNDRAPLEERGSFGTTQAPTAGVQVMAPQPSSHAVAPPKRMLEAGTVIPGLGKASGTQPKTLSSTSVTVQAQPAVSVPTVNVPHPEQCVCAKWAAPEGVTIDKTREHHPMCEWKDKWVAPPAPEKAEEPAKTQPDTEKPPAPPTKMYIINVDSGEAMREAEPHEVEESKKNDGMVTIDGVPYGVVEQALEDVPEEEEQRPESD